MAQTVECPKCNGEMELYESWPEKKGEVYVGFKCRDCGHCIGGTLGE